MIFRRFLGVFSSYTFVRRMVWRCLSRQVLPAYLTPCPIQAPIHEFGLFRHYAAKVSAVEALFKKVAAVINEAMVKETQAVFQFDIKDHGTYFIDLKTGKGVAGAGKPPTPPDAILTVDEKNLLALFEGKLKPKMAVMLGKMKVSGSTVKALKLEGLLPHFRK